jgi:hypothetical protein
MTPPSGTALLLLAFSVLPGLAALLIRERTYTEPSEHTPFEQPAERPLLPRWCTR